MYLPKHWSSLKSHNDVWVVLSRLSTYSKDINNLPLLLHQLLDETCSISQLRLFRKWTYLDILSFTSLSLAAKLLSLKSSSFSLSFNICVLFSAFLSFSLRPSSRASKASLSFFRRSTSVSLGVSGKETWEAGGDSLGSARSSSIDGLDEGC